MKTYWGSGDIALALDGSGQLNNPATLFPGKEPPVPTG